MVQDTFMEHMVKKDPTIADQFKKCGIMLAGLLVVCGSLLLLGSQYVGPIAIAFAVCFGWVTILLLRLQRVEYEYTVTNNEMDIDKIQGKSKRKRMVTVEFGTFESFEKLDPAKPLNLEGKTKIYAAQNMKSTETYVVALKHKDYGESLLFFTPNEEMVEYIKRAMKTRRVSVQSMGK